MRLVDNLIVGFIAIIGISFWVFWFWFWNTGIYEINGVVK